jgi:tetratricopeptide (TPR) repeat protein
MGGAAAAYGDCLFYVGRLAESCELMERASRKGEEIGAGFEVAETNWNLGMHRFLLMDLADAGDRLRRELAKRPRGSARHSQLASRLVAVLAARGELREAHELLREAEPSFRNFHSEVQRAEGHWEDVAATLKASIEESRIRGYGLWECGNTVELAILLRLMGRSEEARTTPLRSPIFSTKSPIPTFELETWARLAIMSAESGHISEAQEELNRCRNFIAPGEDCRGIGQVVVRASS